MGISFITKLLVDFLVENLQPLKVQFYEWLKAKAADSESDVDDELVRVVAALLGLE
jgi:hypothetical protein